VPISYVLHLFGRFVLLNSSPSSTSSSKGLLWPGFCLVLLLLEIVPECSALSLQDNTVLLIGWADCIKVAVVRTRGWDGLTGTLGPGTKYVEIRTSLNTDYYVSGLAPFGDQLVVLAYLPDKDDNAAESIATAFPSQVLESH
jgi:hypothetical protein